MMAVWVVVVVLGAGAAAVAVASRRQHDDVEPSVREFTEFRAAISRQVAGVDADTRSTRRHLDQPPSRPGVPLATQPAEPRSQN